MEEMDGNGMIESAVRRGALSLAAASESTREDEQDCDARGNAKRRIKQSVPDDPQYTLGGDGKCVRICDNGGASGAIVGYSEVKLHCSNEETQSLLFSSKPGLATSGNVHVSSGSRENVQQLRSFEIDPVKHKIFLSHSGAQKNFVEQLCVDLEARGYLFPFFDQRHHSLPEGKDFAPLIKQAARQCHVAVIVLSKEFLCSKWPMIELAEFHASKQGGNQGMSMLPLFYKLEVADLNDESIEGRWIPVWNELASRDKRIDVSRWAAAVRALRRVKGLLFAKHNNSEVGYRKEIVGSIWKMSAGDLQYGSAREMVGYDRICERVAHEFVESDVIGASVLGLYGTSGAGKTIVARGLCDYFAREFEGRVCHVELGALTKRIKRQKLMLKTLCGVEEDVLKRLSDDRQGLKLMRDLMNREPVLLIIDNLTNDVILRIEAHEYLTVGFHPSSKVMITARSKEVLQDLVGGVEFCMSIPKLNEEEAGMIFLKSAAPRKCFSSVTEEERRVLRLCVEKCLMGSFDSGYSTGSKILADTLMTDVPRYGAYHPLALSALGDYFYRLNGNTEVLQWKDSFERDNELMKDVLQSPSITSIIRLQFSTFSWSEQLLFLDLAFYLNTGDGSWRLQEHDTFECWVNRLAILHGETSSTGVGRRLWDLKRSGMIDWKGVNGSTFEFRLHSLYREFAKWYVSEHGGMRLKNARGVFQPCGTSLGSDHRGSKCISDLVRLRVFEGPPRASFWTNAGKRMRELYNLVLLQLHGCTNLRVLSLAGLDNLCHLELVGLLNLVTVTLTESSGMQEDGGIFESLVYVLLEDLDSLTHVPNLRPCSSLHVFAFSNCQKVTNFEGVECQSMRKLWLANLSHQQLGRPPNFKSLHCLTALFICLRGHGEMLDAMGVASPFKLKQRRHGQNIAVHDCEDFEEFNQDNDEFSDDSDAYVFQGDNDREEAIIYLSPEKQFVREGLSIVQNILSFLYEKGCHHNPCESVGDSFLQWNFDEGDNENLMVFPWKYRRSLIEWRRKSPKEYVKA